MKPINYLYFLAAILIGCNADNNPRETETAEAVSYLEKTYSENYLPPYFKDSDRVDRVKGLQDQMHQAFDDHRKSQHIPGLAYGIVMNGELIISGALGFSAPEDSTLSSTKTAFRIASMSKSFTAMGIMILRDQGKISLNDPVEKYIPEVTGQELLTSDSPELDIENLLTMTAGFPEDNPWGDRQLDEPDSMLLSLIDGGLQLSNTPSFTYEYSNTGYAMLGRIITVVSGMPYQEFIRKEIFEPLGMNNTYWELNDVPKDKLAIGYRWENDNWRLEPMLHDGSFGSMGGLITTIEDFSKYVIFHLSAWPPRSDEEEGPLKRSSLREMHTPQFPRLYANARDRNGEECPVMSGYGYGLSINTDCEGIRLVRHGGALPGFGSQYVFYPDYDIGVMAFGNLTYTSPLPSAKISQLIFDSGNLSPRTLPASTILNTRKEQIIDMIQSWNGDLETEILAENFYLDKDREDRIDQIQSVLDEAGALTESEWLSVPNQLRGRFKIKGEIKDVEVFFTLTPGQSARIQRLDVYIDE